MKFSVIVIVLGHSYSLRNVTVILFILYNRNYVTLLIIFRSINININSLYKYYRIRNRI
jgi:hypothetical protein